MTVGRAWNWAGCVVLSWLERRETGDVPSNFVRHGELQAVCGLTTM